MARPLLAVFVLPLVAAGVAAQDHGIAVSPAAQAAAAPDTEQTPPVPPGSPAEPAGAGPAPGVPTVDLGAAVRVALQQNFGLLDSADSVTSARWQESSARGEFYPQAIPLFQRGEGRTLFGVDVSQKLPWTGGTLVATGRYTSAESLDLDFPYASTTDLRLLLRQPLLRNAGPNATYFELTNARRAVTGQERSFELARQRLAVQVAAAFYSVVAQRQLFEVAAQSLARTESLLEASNARLLVGMASKLDVFRAELQAAQAREGMIRTRAALETALEQFRGILALPPNNLVEPEAVTLMEPKTGDVEPLEILVQRALENRLELKESHDRVGDARRAASLAKQNMLPDLNLNLGLNHLGFGSSFGNSFNALDRRVEFFLSASYPIRQTTLKANRAVTELQVGVQQRGVRQLELEIERQVHSAWRDLDRIRQSVEVQLQAVDVAEKQRRLAVLRYQRGLASNFDVVDAESNFVVARSSQVSLLTSYAVARLELQRVTGTLVVEAEFAP